MQLEPARDIGTIEIMLVKFNDVIKTEKLADYCGTFTIPVLLLSALAQGI